MTGPLIVRMLTPREPACEVRDYLAAASLQETSEIIFFEDVPDRREFEPGLYVFTGLNRLGPKTAELLADLHAQLSDGVGVAPLNHPLGTLRRYELLRMLKAEGLNDFTAFGAWEDFSAVRFPAFVRPREVDGTIPRRLRSLREVERAIGAFVLDGWRPEELLVVEFEDVADARGLYTKYSAFVIGERVVPVSLDVDRHWVVRAGNMLSGPDLAEATMRYVTENPHEAQLKEIFRKSRTRFGRIDYSVKGGRVQTWEINTLPTLIRRRPETSPMLAERERRRALFRAAFSEAWRQLVADAVPGRTVCPRFDTQLRAAARQEMAERGGIDGRGRHQESLVRLRSLLRPLKPILKPLASYTLYPVLARRARRALDRDPSTATPARRASSPS